MGSRDWGKEDVEREETDKKTMRNGTYTRNIEYGPSYLQSEELYQSLTLP